MPVQGNSGKDMETEGNMDHRRILQHCRTRAGGVRGETLLQGHQAQIIKSVCDMLQSTDFTL